MKYTYDGKLIVDCQDEKPNKPAFAGQLKALSANLKGDTNPKDLTYEEIVESIDKSIKSDNHLSDKWRDDSWYRFDLAGAAVWTVQEDPNIRIFNISAMVRGKDFLIGLGEYESIMILMPANKEPRYYYCD